MASSFSCPNPQTRDGGDEVPALTLSPLAVPREIGAAMDVQFLQSSEPIYPFWQGCDAWTAPNQEHFKGGEVANGLGNASQQRQPRKAEFA